MGLWANYGCETEQKVFRKSRAGVFGDGHNALSRTDALKLHRTTSRRGAGAADELFGTEHNE